MAASCMIERMALPTAAHVQPIPGLRLGRARPQWVRRGGTWATQDGASPKRDPICRVAAALVVVGALVAGGLLLAHRPLLPEGPKQDQTVGKASGRMRQGSPYGLRNPGRAAVTSQPSPGPESRPH